MFYKVVVTALVTKHKKEEGGRLFLSSLRFNAGGGGDAGGETQKSP